MQHAQRGDRVAGNRREEPFSLRPPARPQTGLSWGAGAGCPVSRPGLAGPEGPSGVGPAPPWPCLGKSGLPGRVPLEGEGLGDPRRSWLTSDVARPAQRGPGEKEEEGICCLELLKGTQDGKQRNCVDALPKPFFFSCPETLLKATFFLEDT